MKICISCGTKYEDNETLCHKCDKKLTGKNVKTKPTDRDELVVKLSRRKIVSVHNGIGGLYILLFIAIIYPNLVSNVEFNSMVLFMLFFPFTHFLAAYGIAKDKGWGRGLSLVIGIVLLFGFPVGTIIGGVIIYQLSKKEWSYFDTEKSNVHKNA